MSAWTAVGVCLFLVGVAAQQGPPAVDPCSLVTRAEAEQVIGPLKKTPAAQTQDQVKTCEYAAADGKDGLELWVLPEGGLERARDAYKDLKPVTDLEQPAFIRRHPSIAWVELYTRKNGVTLEVTMKVTPGVEDKVKAFAKKALARM